MESTLGDFRQSFRRLRQSPGFATVVMLTLAVGIGVNVAIFSLTEQILLQPLPAAEPERLVNLSNSGPRLTDQPSGLPPEPGAPGIAFPSIASESVFSYPIFRDLERAQGAPVRVAAHRIFDANVSTGEQARRETGMFVSGSYFSVLGLQPALGRLLGPIDDRVDGQAESVVLSHAHWRRELGGDPQVLGRTLIVNGAPLTVVGVAPPGFHGTTVGVRASVFVPITFPELDTGGRIPNHYDRDFHWVHLFGRLDPGISRQEAEAAIDTYYRGIVSEIEAPLEPGGVEQEVEASRIQPLVLEPGAHGQSTLLAPAQDRLELLFAASGIVLLLCAGNVGALMLVRGSTRTGEMAVRASVGATRGRLASLVLAESLLLAVPAALLSLPVAYLTLRVLGGRIPGIPAFDATLSFTAVLVAIGVAVASALAFGLFPVRDLIRVAPGNTLHAGGARQTSGKGVKRFRTGLATVQVALSMALLSVTGVFAQTLANIARVELGLDVDSIVMFSMSPETSGYTLEASARLFDRMEEELSAIPGVMSAASAMVPVLSGSSLNTRVAADGADGPFQVGTAVNSVSPEFFRTLGIPLLRGRDFSDADAFDATPVVIVTQRLAEDLGFGPDVLGRRIRVFGREAEIVGLAADAKYVRITGEVESMLFQPRRQRAGGVATFYIRAARPPEDLMNAVRATASRVDPVVPITELVTMPQQVRENIATERLVAGTSTAFAVLATVLAGFGIYGVLAYSVMQRSREIGLHLALGAPMNRIRAIVLRPVAAMALAGVALGVVAAWLLGRAARSLLFGVDAADPIAVASAALVLAAVMLCAAYIPARRASRVDPMAVLRYE